MSKNVQHGGARGAVSAETLLHAILHATTDVAFVVTDTNAADPRALEFSPGAERMFGYTRNEMLGAPVARLNLPEDVKRYAAVFSAMKRRGEGFNGETTLLRKSGERFRALFTTYPVTDAAGVMTAVLAVAVDISHLRRTEAALDEKTLELQRFFETSIDLLCVADIAGHFRYLNAQWERSFGYTLADLQGTEFLRLVHADDVEATRAAMAQLASQQPVQGMVNRYRCKDGSWRWLEWRASPVGGLIYAAARDITERKQDEQAVRQSQEDLKRATVLLESVLDAIPDVIGLQYPDHRIVRYNLAGYRFLNMRAEETAGRRCFELIGRQSPCEQCATTRALQTRAPERLEKYIEHLRVWLDCRAYPVLDEAGNVLYVVEHLRDITERMNAEQQLSENQQHIAHLQKMDAIGQLAGGVAHDFNNQLAGILGCADVLKSELKGSGEHEQLLQTIVDAARRASELTAQLLAFARKGRVVCERVDLHESVASVVALLLHGIDKRIEMRQTLQAQSCVTEGDPTQIQNALLNLALNARDAMPQGGELCFCSTLVTLDEEFCAQHVEELEAGTYVRLSVGDTGVGIAPELLAKVFEPFFTTKTKGLGSGMGLASVYGTMKSHRGAVRVYSEVGKGTTFTLYFPLSNEPGTVRKDAAGKLCSGIGCQRILLVDDEEVVRFAAAAILRKAGCTVTQCNDGREAVEVYRDAWQSIDLVLLDLVMPHMSGGEAMRRMLAVNPDAVILLSSGYSINGEAESLLALGARGFVQKPFLVEELLEKIAEALGHTP